MGGGGRASGVRQSRERQRKFKRVSVYWRTSLSSQKEFFPCFITVHLPIRKCLWRKVESPPDVISSTFTYNHIEKQHGLKHVQYTEYLQCSIHTHTDDVAMVIGLKQELSRDKATRTQLITNPLNSCWPKNPQWAHAETHRTRSACCVNSPAAVSDWI